jgi:hypothetical protein
MAWEFTGTDREREWTYVPPGGKDVYPAVRAVVYRVPSGKWYWGAWKSGERAAVYGIEPSADLAREKAAEAIEKYA